jgi:hypothetical protein
MLAQLVDGLHDVVGSLCEIAHERLNGLNKLDKLKRGDIIAETEELV